MYSHISNLNATVPYNFSPSGFLAQSLSSPTSVSYDAATDTLLFSWALGQFQLEGIADAVHVVGPQPEDDDEFLYVSSGDGTSYWKIPREHPVQQVYFIDQDTIFNNDFGSGGSLPSIAEILASRPFDLLDADAVWHVNGTQFRDEIFLNDIDGSNAYGNAGDDHLVGGEGGNELVGGLGYDWLDGQEGDDTLDGRPPSFDAEDFDVADYRYSGEVIGGVFVNLAGGSAIDQFDGVDTLYDIEGVHGSLDNDVLYGGNPDNNNVEAFWGFAGDDEIDGGDGYDEARYDTDASEGGYNGVVVNLSDLDYDIGYGTFFDGTPPPEQNSGNFVYGGTARDGFNNTDDLYDIEGVWGTHSADVLIGNDGHNNFIGLGGADRFIGGDGFDNVSYFPDASYGVIVNLSESDFVRTGLNASNFGISSITLAGGRARDGHGSIDLLEEIETADGSARDDIFIGSDFGDNFFSGGDGADEYIGGEGLDTGDGVGFGAESGAYGVIVNLSGQAIVGPFQTKAGPVSSLQGSRAIDSYGNVETLSQIEDASGTHRNDIFVGDGDHNFFEGFDGADTYVGGGGNDQVSYEWENGTRGVRINLSSQNQPRTGDPLGPILAFSGFDTYGNAETFKGSAALLGGTAENGSSIESIRGSRNADVVYGNGLNNTFIGFDGADEFHGGDGADRVRYDRDINQGGNKGVVVNLSSSSQPITGPQAAGMGYANAPFLVLGSTALDGFGKIDRLFNIEDARGTERNDFFFGNSVADNPNTTHNEAARGNHFEGLGGNDKLVGGAGDDDLDAGTGDDTVEAGAGDDFIRGTAGTDSVNGGPGYDVIGFSGTLDEGDGGPDGEVVVTLNGIKGGGTITGTIADGAVNTTFQDMERVEGTEGDDTFSAGPGVIFTDEAEYTFSDGRGGGRAFSFVGAAGYDEFFDESGHAGGVVMVNYDAEKFTREDFDGFWGDGDDESGVEVYLDEGEPGYAFDTFGDEDTLYGVKAFRLTDAGDYFYGNGDGNYVEARAGDDYVQGGAGDDEFYGGDGVDEIIGGLGNDLIGDVGADADVDTLTGGEADDSETAFAAAAVAGDQDTYRLSWATGSVADVVTDFEAGADGDIIDVSRILPLLSNLPAGADPFKLHLRVSQDGDDTVLEMNRDGAGDDFEELLVLRNTTVADFVAENFSPVYRNAKPDAVNDALDSSFEDGGTRTIPGATLLANDSIGTGDGGQALRITSVGNAVGGTVTLSNGNVLFTPAADFNGPASFTYTVSDNGTTMGVSDMKRDTATASFTVTAVNDAPTAAAPASYSATEQVPLSLKNTGLSVADIDAGNGVVKATLTVAQGVLNVTPGTSGATVAGSGTSTVTLTGTLAQINALLNSNGTSTVSYLNSSDAPAASAALTLTVNDQGNTGGGPLTGSDTATINITAVNDAPTATAPLSYSATEQVALSLKNTGLSVADVDAGHAVVKATLTVGQGVLNVTPGTSGATVVGSGTSTVTLTGTLAQINALLNSNGTSTVSYLNSSNTPASSTTLTLSVDDQGGSGTGGPLGGADTATINIAAVNDAPVAAIAPASYAATEQVALSLKSTGLSVADVDAGNGVVQATLSVTQGVLNVTAGTSGATVAGSGTSAVTLTGTLAQINALLNTNGTSTVSYLNSSNTPAASAALTLSVNDQGNSGTGGSLVGSDTATINITAVNDAPVAAITPASYAATEQVALSLKNTGLSVADVDAGSGVVKATLSVTQGVLNVTAGTSGAAVAGSGTSAVTLTGTLAQINALLNTNGTSTVSYLNSSNAPASSAGLTLSVNDQGNTGTGGSLVGSDTATINITAVNDAPTAAAPLSYAATEQVPLSLKNSGLSIADVDAGGGVVKATLSVTQGVLNVAPGTSGATVTGNGTSTVTLTGTLAQINALLNSNATSTVSYLNSSNTPAASAALTLSVNDQGHGGTGGALAGSDTATINITAVNDAPLAAIALPGYNATGAVTLSLKNTGLSVADVDAGSGILRVTLSVGQGALNASAGNSGATVLGSGTSALTLTGTLAQINALLGAASTSTLTYANTSDVAAANTVLTLSVNDQGNTGTGGAKLGSDTATLLLWDSVKTNQAGTVFGAASNDFVGGDANVNQIVGLLGNDLLKGEGGDDTLWGDGDTANPTLGGNDRLFGGEGNDKGIGGAGHDFVSLGNGDDTGWGDAGDDIVNGDAGNDKLHGGDGNDVMDGGIGDDIVYGQVGNDNIQLGTGADKAWGGVGNDVIRGGADDDQIVGEDGNDFLFGDAGNDALYGDAGNDSLTGGLGDDQFAGGAGKDILFFDAGTDTGWGGADDDAFVFTPGNGRDTVKDYQVGTAADPTLDVLIFQGFASTSLTLQNITVGAVSGTQVSVGGQAVVFLEGVQSTSLKPDDFSFIV